MAEFEVARPDAAAALRVARAAGLAWDAREAERRVALAGDGALLAVASDGEPVGLATCTVYAGEGGGALAWVGGPWVEPSWRGRGVERALLRAAVEDARARGAADVGLDATEGTARFAEAEGFEEVGATREWARPPDAPPQAPARSERYAIYPVSSCEIMELLQYDAPRFGARRGPLLAQLVAEEPHRSFVAVDRATGAFSGFALAGARRLGPLVADAPDAAAWLLWACERAGAPARALADERRGEGARAFEAAGWRPAGEARARMSLGGRPLPGQAGRLHAVAGRGLG